MHTHDDGDMKMISLVLHAFAFSTCTSGIPPSPGEQYQ